MSILQRIQQKSEAQRRVMMLAVMFVLSSAIVYVWFQSLDLGGIAQNPIEQIAQTGNTKTELTPLRSLWLNAQILGSQFRKAGAGLNLIREKIFGMQNNATNVANEPKMAIEENKKSFFGTIKDVMKYNVGVMENMLKF
ncbi:hypothetical protein KGQ34_03415 [Patescibacteria group bacterium]|nr:hypothetical protein [Patescibacteria group bacterium]